MKLLTVLMALAVGLAIAAPRALAGDPTVEPSPTPLAQNQFRIRVVLDENGDGLAQTGEPGIGGAHVHGGCGDAISLYETDADGYVTAFATPGIAECFALQRQFGWLPTTPAQFRVDIAQLDPSFPTLFLIHDLGDSVMELRGEVIVDGLPDRQPEFGDQAPPFTGGPASPCVEPAEDAFARRVLIVVGADQRMHCPTSGAGFGIVLNGQTIGDYTFTPRQTAETAFVSGPDSMRFYALDVDTAIVIDAAGRTTGTDCAVIEEITGFVPPESVRVYVMPDELRPGCAAPGRRVVLLRDGQRLEPALDWRTGSVDVGRAFEIAQQPVTPPNTGSGDTSRGGAGGAIALLLGSSIAGASCVAAGTRMRSQRR